jgi:hypothetical protein
MRNVFLFICIISAIVLTNCDVDPIIPICPIPNKIVKIKITPIYSGCLLGAYLGGPDDITQIGIEEFNKQFGKNHAAFVKYIQGCQYGLMSQATLDLLKNWSVDLKKNSAYPVLIINIDSGLRNFTDIEFKNSSLEIAYNMFADFCDTIFNKNVFIVFGQEMNLPNKKGYFHKYHSWGQQAAEYKMAFIKIANIFHQCKFRGKFWMSWVPNQEAGYPWGTGISGSPYDDYYPGDDYVDWVGLSYVCYDKYALNDSFHLAGVLKYIDNSNENFYQHYSNAKNKPMMLCCTSVCDPNLSNENECDSIKNKWISELYNVDIIKG